MPTAGVNQKFWAKIESTFDTVSAFAATDALDLIELSIEASQEYEDINSHVGTGSLQGEVAGKKTGTWSASAYIMPAAAGTAPDIGPLLKAAFGTETVVGGTSVTYSLSDGNVMGTSLHSLQLAKYAGADHYEIANGAWVEQVEVDISAGSPPKITFSGGFATYGYVYGSPAVSGVHSTSATSIALATNDGKKVAVNSLVKFGSEDNGGSGYTVTAVSGDTLTITPGLAGGLSGGEAVEPVVPSQTLGGSVIGGTACGLDIDGSAIGFISGKTTLSTGIKPLDKEASSAKATAIFRAEARKVEGELQVYFLDENTEFIGGAWSGTVRDIEQRAGANTAGARMKVNTDAARIGTTAVGLTDGEATTVSLPFKARQNAAAADELTLVFD